jgi:hypothetical protein
MNQIEMVTALPDWKWKENSAKEIALTGADLVAETDLIYQIGRVAVAGFIYSSLVAPPWMWFVLADKVKLADLIDFRKFSLQIPKGTLTAVGVDFPVALRFAEVYDFVDTGQEVENSGRFYKLMRKV